MKRFFQMAMRKALRQLLFEREDRAISRLNDQNWNRGDYDLSREDEARHVVRTVIDALVPEKV